MNIKRTLALFAAIACMGLTACSDEDSSSKSDKSSVKDSSSTQSVDDSKGDEPAQSTPDDSSEDETPAAPSKTLDEIKADYAEAEVKSNATPIMIYLSRFICQWNLRCNKLQNRLGQLWSVRNGQLCFSADEPERSR